jgi:hypothetical protein
VDNEQEYFLARLAYTKYGKITGFKNFLGEPMPKFDDLTEIIKEAWKAASSAIYELAMEEEGYPPKGEGILKETIGGLPREEQEKFVRFAFKEE